MSRSIRKILHVHGVLNIFSSSKSLKLEKCDTLLSRNISLFRNPTSAKVTFHLSDIGEGIKEVVIKEWFVKEGDKVSQFDEICEVQSDKASVTITSRYDGVVSKLHHNVDAIALVGKPLVDIETDQDKSIGGNNLSLKSKTKNENTVEYKAKIHFPNGDKLSPSVTRKDFAPRLSKTVHQNNGTVNNSVLSIPSVKKLAKLHNIDLTDIQGSGKHGRILKEDVMKHVEQTSHSPDIGTTGIRAITGFQKIMVKTMTESLKIPHFVYSDEIKVTKLSELRSVLKKSENTTISFLPFFVKAASNALHKYPILNTSVDEKCENIIYHTHHHVGIAMDTKDGLAVPVIKHVENLSIVDISKELQRLMICGKEGTFSPADLCGGTFSISNIGSIGGTYTKPIILPPQVAIVALGTAQTLPRFDENRNIIPEEIINISAAADHRIVDGATMASFINKLKKEIEAPYLLFLNIN